MSPIECRNAMALREEGSGVGAPLCSAEGHVQSEGKRTALEDVAALVSKVWMRCRQCLLPLDWFQVRSRYALRLGGSMKRILGTKVCTGDFTPPEPEFIGSNSGKRILDARILDPNSRVEFFDSVFSSKCGPQKNSPSRNSPPKIHLPKFNPEIGPKNSHCPSAGPFG